MIKAAVCQTNTITGNIQANCRLIVRSLRRAAASGARLVVFSELAITGYPPRDLLEYPRFIYQAMRGVELVHRAAVRMGVWAVVGAPWPNPFGGKKALCNAALVVGQGFPLPHPVFKKLLPTYDVFDEHRYFHEAPGDHLSGLVALPGTDIRLGITICEDIWNDNQFWEDDRLYETDPVRVLVENGADILVNISASPFVVGKPQKRLEMLAHTARRWQRPIIFTNQVGGNDQVVFDGGSLIMSAHGHPVASAGWFQSSEAVADIASDAPMQPAPCPHDALDSIEAALRLGLRDYLGKTGFSQVVLGNSGGIDSALVLSLCALELGADRVISVSLPGPYTSEETRADSTEIARRWGVRHLEIPILPAYDAYRDMLLATPTAEREAEHPLHVLFADDPAKPHKIANENLQSRLRGVSLMWLSNAITDKRTLVVTTGNKSELATGYCTLYGDMCGGLALISDLPKMMVYALSRHLNTKYGDKIPQTIIDREPTAELAPGQKDSDSLPPYPVLDELVRLYVEERLSADEIIARGVADAPTVRRVTRLIDLNEYKRQQAAPGIKVTSKAFGVGRRMPIARGA